MTFVLYERKSSLYGKLFVLYYNEYEDTDDEDDD
jgi:hypothetical protein